ncbi:hypothetical protein M758_8G021800 [Ceratodon purpureus]|nr:hypothetical protein M758_8G021800 [Ceratodon purpureus]
MGRIASFPSSWSKDTEAFVLSSEHRPSSGADSGNDDVPVISLKPLFDALGAELAKGSDWAAISAKVEQSEDSALRSLVEAIGNACAEWGFFQVIDHEVPRELLHKVKDVAKEFFTLPVEEKKKIGRSFDRHLGYNDSELTKNTRDWKEIFDWAAIGYMEMPETVESDYRSGKYSKTTVKSYNQWPEKPEGFRDACEEYTAAVVHLASLLLGLITVSLGLPFNLFHHCFDTENTIRARLNYYPQCPLADMVCGVNRHVDSGALTVLAQDDVGGLQVRCLS